MSKHYLYIGRFHRNEEDSSYAKTVTPEYHGLTLLVRESVEKDELESALGLPLSFLQESGCHYREEGYLVVDLLKLNDRVRNALRLVGATSSLDLVGSYGNFLENVDALIGPL